MQLTTCMTPICRSPAYITYRQSVSKAFVLLVSICTWITFNAWTPTDFRHRGLWTVSVETRSAIGGSNLRSTKGQPHCSAGRSDAESLPGPVISEQRQGPTLPPSKHIRAVAESSYCTPILTSPQWSIPWEKCIVDITHLNGFKIRGVARSIAGTQAIADIAIKGVTAASSTGDRNLTRNKQPANRVRNHSATLFRTYSAK